MKLFNLLAILVLALSSVGPASPGNAQPIQQSSDEERAQALLDTLRPEERVGQLFLATFTGTDAGPTTDIYDLIVNHHLGGVILQAENDNFSASPQTLPDLLRLDRQIQSNEWSASQKTQTDPNTNTDFTPAFIPLFIGISQEGDGYPYDQILGNTGITPLPSEMALGATWDPELAKQVGQVEGKELTSLGINFLLGPSLDVLYSPQTMGPGGLGVRTFGGDPYWVGEMGRAYITGVHEGGNDRIAVIAKHFPGHGGSNRLPEEEIATVFKTLEELIQVDLPPFFAVTGNATTITSTVDGLLASHIRYQGLQGNIRETTRPVSLDPKASAQLMSLPEIASWRSKGGIMVTDNLGSRAFRRFYDPTGNNFNAPLIARDAFYQTQNDLLFLGNQFIATGDSGVYTTTVRTLDLFTRKYNEDMAFKQRVDQSVLRILTLKFRMYDELFTLENVQPPLNSLLEIGRPEAEQVTFNAAKAAATLISPSIDALAETIPEPPGLNDRIVFITDEKTGKQCSLCPEQPVFAKNALEQAVIRLYGPLAGGQVLARNLESYSFSDLQAFLDNVESDSLKNMLSNLEQANWIVFSMLQVKPDNPASQVLSRFLAEKPQLYRQKKLIVFAFNAPYYLDQTEVSKVTAFYGLYSKTPQFIDVAARLLFMELPAPPGALPVSVPGVSYDLTTATFPDPSQIIPLSLDLPGPVALNGTVTPEPTLAPEFEVGELVPVRAGPIVDHNGHQVPDDTLVQFTFSLGNEVINQTEGTIDGVARTSFLIDRSGQLTIQVSSEPATNSDVLRFDIPPQGGEVLVPTASPSPTSTQTPQPSATATLAPQVTPTVPPPERTHLGDWFLALLTTAAIGALAYWLISQFGILRWGVRGAFLALIGGMLAYTYLALDLPGSEAMLKNSGSWGVLLLTMLGAGAGLLVSWGWQQLDNRSREGRT